MSQYLTVSEQTVTPPSPRRPLGRAFVVAAIVLAVFAFAQLVAVSLYCIPLLQDRLKALHQPTLFEGSQLQAAQQATPQQVQQELERVIRMMGGNATPELRQELGRIVASMAASTQQTFEAYRPSRDDEPAQQSEPAPRVDPAETMRTAQSRQLVEEADSKYRVGGFDEALALLQKAEELLPSEPNIQFRIGLIKEALGDSAEAYLAFDRAASTPGLPSELKRQAEKKMELISLNLADSGTSGTPKTPVEFGEGARDEDGLQPGAEIGVISAKWQPDADAAKKTLRIAIKTRPAVEVEPQQVTVAAYIYEKDASGDIVVVEQDEKRVFTKWLSPTPSWANGQPELLDIDYIVPQGNSGKKLLGYTVAIYYNNALQDVSASPEVLLQQFPPKLSIED